MSRPCPDCRRRELHETQPTADRWKCTNCGASYTLEELSDDHGQRL